MPSYNLMKREDRIRMRQDRQDELDAVNSGQWPRDINDRMRWSAGTAENAARMCKTEIAYLDGVDDRISQGDPSLAGWE